MGERWPILTVRGQRYFLTEAWKPASNSALMAAFISMSLPVTSSVLVFLSALMDETPLTDLSAFSAAV